MKRLAMTMAMLGVTSAAYSETAKQRILPKDELETAAAQAVDASWVPPVTASAAKDAAEPSESLSLDNILKQDIKYLEKKYREPYAAQQPPKGPGPIPAGDTDGHATPLPGSPLGYIMEAIAPYIWQGKTFEHKRGPDGKDAVTLLNKLGIVGKGAPANVYLGKSLIDGNYSIILDYSIQENADIPGVGILMSNIRDEIREVAPNLYLGYAFLRVSKVFQPETIKALGQIATVLEMDGEKYVLLAYFALQPTKSAVGR